jgi:hypothetical protein
MSTYRNCYDILEEVRLGLNEYSTAYLQGTSTSGAYQNSYLVRKINAAQRYLYALLFKAKPEHFLTAPTSIAVTSSVITKPADLYRIYELRDADGNKVFPSDPRDLPVGGGVGSENLYYEQAGNIRLNKSGVTATYTIVYYTQPHDLTQGTAANTNTLATTATPIADYYNNVLLEDITGSAVLTISDYSASRVITPASGSLASASYYGTISDLPENFHHFIGPKAIQLVNMEFPVAQGADSNSSLLTTKLNEWESRLAAELAAFTGPAADVDIEDIFADYGVSNSRRGVNVPGQGYGFR